MNETERLITAILKYTGAADAHSPLSTVHMLANDLLDSYRKEKADTDKQLLELNLLISQAYKPTPNESNNADL